MRFQNPAFLFFATNYTDCRAARRVWRGVTEGFLKIRGDQCNPWLITNGTV